jgi:hypothetical protein
MAEKRFRWRLRIVYRKVVVVYRVKTKDETNMRNRYVAETQTDKRETDLSNNPSYCRSIKTLLFVNDIPSIGDFGCFF